MERRLPDTMPLPVVETVVAPAVPPPTAALPVEPPAPPSQRRDRTPLVLGLLALAAVLALVLSALALARDDRPAAPLDPAAGEPPPTVPASQLPATTPSSAAPPPTAVARPTPTTAATARTLPPTTAVAPAVEPSGRPGKGKGDGKGKD